MISIKNQFCSMLVIDSNFNNMEFLCKDINSEITVQELASACRSAIWWHPLGHLTNYSVLNNFERLLFVFQSSTTEDIIIWQKQVQTFTNLIACNSFHIQISYLFEQYIGENSINNYSKKHAYICQEGKLMTKSEFISTFNMGLSFIEERTIDSDKQQLSKLFDQINCKGFNMISHEDYLQCMKEYFGSLSPMAINPTEKIIKMRNSEFLSQKDKEQKQNAVTTTKGSSNQIAQTKFFEIPSHKKTQQEIFPTITGLEQLRDLIVAEIKRKCSEFDKDKDQRLDKDETYSFFYQILMLQKHSIQYILENYFHFQQFKNVSFLELTEVISEVHFRQIFSSLLKQETNIDNPNKILLNQEQFSNKLLQSCFFFKDKPPLQLITKVFSQLINRSQLKLSDCISLQDFRAYILSYLCKSRLIFRQSVKKNAQYAFINMPISITEAQNSHFQQDSSYNQIRPRQFDSSINEQRHDQNLFDQRFQNDSKISNNRASIHQKKTDNQKSIQNNHARVMIETQYVLAENPIQTDALIENNKLQQINKQPQSVKIIYTQIQSNEIITDRNLCGNPPQDLNAKVQIKSYIKNLTGTLSIENIINQCSEKKIVSDQQIEDEFSQNKVKSGTKEAVIHQQSNFKQKIWKSLKEIINKYTLFPHQMIRKETVELLIANQQIFMKKQSKLGQKLQLYFKKSEEMPVQLLISYIIHVLGEEALIKFNKSQIKGKSTLQQQELTNILFEAYDTIINQVKESYRIFSHELIITSNTSQFTYNSLLTFIGRNLSTC